MKITLFIPVRNEIEGSKLIMPRIDRDCVDEIIVVDGHSTDGTPEYYKENGYTVIHQKSTGVCGAFWECYDVATGDVIIPFSPDNNSIPELLPDLVAKIKEGYDMVIVSRYKDGATSDDDDMVTAFGNWMFTKLVNVFFGANYTDTLVIYRAFKKDLIDRLKIKREKYPVFEYLMDIRCAKAKCKVADIPGDEPARVGGVRKMSPIYNGSTLLYIFFRELFYTPPGVKK